VRITGAPPPRRAMLCSSSERRTAVWLRPVSVANSRSERPASDRSVTNPCNRARRAGVGLSARSGRRSPRRRPPPAVAPGWTQPARRAVSSLPACSGSDVTVALSWLAALAGGLVEVLLAAPDAALPPLLADVGAVGTSAAVTLDSRRTSVTSMSSSPVWRALSPPMTALPLVGAVRRVSALTSTVNRLCPSVAVRPTDSGHVSVDTQVSVDTAAVQSTQRQKGWPAGSRKTRNFVPGWTPALVAPKAITADSPSSRSATIRSRCICCGTSWPGHCGGW